MKRAPGAAPSSFSPRLWLISAGHPRAALRAYGFKRMRGWPAGVWQRCDADALGLVVVCDLPRTRDTLILRLMGAGAVLREAIAELQRLPGEAWERRVAMPLLLATRLQLPQDGSEEAREFMMSTQSLYEQWAHQLTEKGIEKGREQTLRHALLTVYRARFGAVPAEMAATLDATHEVARLERWLEMVGACSAEDFASALRACAA